MRDECSEAEGGSTQSLEWSKLLGSSSSLLIRGGSPKFNDFSIEDWDWKKNDMKQWLIEHGGFSFRLIYVWFGPTLKVRRLEPQSMTKLWDVSAAVNGPTQGHISTPQRKFVEVVLQYPGSFNKLTQ